MCDAAWNVRAGVYLQGFREGPAEEEDDDEPWTEEDRAATGEALLKLFEGEA